MAKQHNISDTNVLEMLLAQKPQIPKKRGLALEQSIAESENDDGITRRCGLASLGLSGRELFDSITSDRDAAVAMANLRNALQDYVKRLRSLADTMETAEVRIMIALCGREDMGEIEREADHA